MIFTKFDYEPFEATVREHLRKLPLVTIYCKMGGIMEDPDFHWEPIGKAPGATLKEACDNLAVIDSEFKRDYDPTTMTFWGWKLGEAKDAGL